MFCLIIKNLTMIRTIIKIDEEKCNGCALCIPECKEGAIQIINEKAKLINDMFCDGLGACIGHCPEGAITFEQREAEPYNEKLVIDRIANEPEVLKAHLIHLIEHKEINLYNEAVQYLETLNITNPLAYNSKIETTEKISPQSIQSFSGCPGSRPALFNEPSNESVEKSELRISPQLRQWPIQLHLVPPSAPYFQNREMIIMSTCGPVAYANIQNDYIKDRSIVLACPKLDYTEPYRDKLASIFFNNNINNVIVLIMEVPCCKGLTKFAVDAAEIAGKSNISIEEHTITLDGKLKFKQKVYGK